MKKTAVCLSLLLALALCLSCALAEITVTDMMGRDITLQAPAKRVVAVTAADCEILYALGAGDTLVGRGAYCNYPEAVLSVPAVESGFETNVEQIIALAPDVVLMNTMNQPVEQVQALENAGIPVCASTASDIAGVYDAIAIIGALTGKDAEAAALCDDMRARFAALSENADENAGKTVYFEVSPLAWGLWTAGGDTFMNEIARLLGLENAFADVSGWAEISQEQVIARNPDYIVTITADTGEGQTPVEEIMAREGWQGLAAVQNARAFAADPDTLSRPGPRLTDAAEALAQFIHQQ